MVVEVAGAPKEKAPEKNSLPMPIDVTDPNFEVRDEKDYPQSGKAKACCQILLFIGFMVLLATTIYFSYSSFEYQRGLKRCAAAHDELQRQLANMPKPGDFSKAVRDYVNKHNLLATMVPQNNPQRPANKPYMYGPNRYDFGRPMDTDEEHSWEDLAGCLSARCLRPTPGQDDELFSSSIDAKCLGNTLKDKKKDVLDLLKKGWHDIFRKFGSSRPNH